MNSFGKLKFHKSMGCNRNDIKSAFAEALSKTCAVMFSDISYDILIVELKIFLTLTYSLLNIISNLETVLQ